MPATHCSKRLRQIQQPNSPVDRLSTPHAASILPPADNCGKCGATKFAFETANFCCCNEEVQLVDNVIPPQLLDLFGGNDENATHFKKYARLYNNMFAFSSLGGSTSAESRKGIYIFKLQGQIDHFIPTLLPTDNNPKYMQLYFYDSLEETHYRAGTFPEIRLELIEILMEVMQQNPYSKFFRSLRELRISENTVLKISHNPTLDQRVYNAPSSNEVAAVLVECNNQQDYNGPHILVHGKDSNTHRIMHYYGCYDPLQYPFLHPRGESGWHQGLQRHSSYSRNQHTGRTSLTSAEQASDPLHLFDEEVRVSQRAPSNGARDISCREYYGYKLQIRAGNYLLHAGSLFQQYIVDMYVKIENTRLDFLRRNQSTIRAELYQGIIDSLQAGHATASDIGHRTILPPSFVGGPRDVKRRYLNAMALVQKFGKPDLFITMTCNPNWSEIKDNLLRGEKSEDRPDITARVFNAKLLMLKNEIFQNHIFGLVVARVDVVEFQKRGLPHAHLLIILQSSNKIISPDTFDQYVNAEIPSGQTPNLRAAVLRHMIHGPCGPRHPNCPCMKHKGNTSTCKFRYPKNFADFTTCGDDSYPVYKRRNTGEKIRIRGEWIDNSSVIPYNPYLLATFDCHINVEICSTITAVKYLYKYIYKGHDCVSFNLIQGAMRTPDEISSYQNARWISPPEAAWRIFGFHLYDIYPAVIPLQVHLPNMQTINFRESEDLTSITGHEHRSRTMLTEFLSNNKTSQNQTKYLYTEYPEHYVWNSSLKIWTIRKTKTTTIGRLTYASPSEGKRYYLRVLLSHVPGPQSFIDLLTIDSHTYKSFQEVAQQRGLLQADNYAESGINEAIQFQMPNALCHLFSTLLVFCEPQNSLALWTTHYKSLSEDFAKLFPSDNEKVMQLTVTQIETHLEAMGKTLRSYNLHEISPSPTYTIPKDIRDALTSPVAPEFIDAHTKLNSKQLNAYKSIMQHVTNGESGAFFIDGPGGTCKTFLYCALYATLRSIGKIVLPTATSGIAASNIPTGRTAHSRFKIPIDEDNLSTCNISKQSSLAQLIRETSLIIWDEASMAKKENIESLHHLLQDICDSDRLFGGKVVVLGGDFRQVLPVLPGKTQHEALNASLISSYLWPQLQQFKLTTNMRAQEDPSFSNFLLELGNGNLQHDEHAPINIPPTIILNNTDTDDDFQFLAQAIFPEMHSSPTNVQIYSERAILTPTNDGVNRINESLIHQFAGEPTTYHSLDSVNDDNCTTFTPEFLNTLCPAGMSPHKLILKENYPVILLRNLDPSRPMQRNSTNLQKVLQKHHTL